MCLFSGRWEPGEYDYRFELRAPDLPTRQGPLVGWRWLVVATADIPLDLDPRGEAEVRVPASGPEPLDVRPSREETDQDEQRDLIWAGKVLTAFFLLVAAAGFGLERFELVGETGGAVIQYGGLALAALSVVYTVRDWIRLRRIRRTPSVELRWEAPSNEDDSAPPGILRCDVRSPFEDITRMVARLEVKEYTRYKQLRGTRTYEIHEDEETLVRTKASLSRGDEAGQWTGELPLPAIGDRVPPFTKTSKGEAYAGSSSCRAIRAGCARLGSTRYR